MTILENIFDNPTSDKFQNVYYVEPKVFGDSRGSFSEVMKEDMDPFDIFCSLGWIKQVNRSKSAPLVVRGLHAQKAPYCQSKLVEAITGTVYDVIIDARPDSKSFGTSTAVMLDSERQNKLFVPRGFLHGFVVPENSVESTVFNYYCDNVYDKESEITVNPKTFLASVKKCMFLLEEDDVEYRALEEASKDGCIYSDKDLSGLDYYAFMKGVKDEYRDSGKVWYR